MAEIFCLLLVMTRFNRYLYHLPLEAQLLHVRDCTSETARQRLHVRDCTSETARQRLHVRDCTAETARQRLHGREYYCEA